jgi:hypothetical protein
MSRFKSLTSTSAITLFLATLGFARDSEPAQRLVTPLVEDLEPLRDDFNRDSNAPRLVVVLSPT